MNAPLNEHIRKLTNYFGQGMFYYSHHKVIDAPQYVITDASTLPKTAIKWMPKQKRARGRQEKLDGRKKDHEQTKFKRRPVGI
jgi:hypothetical protein